jgi:hypothetical protein
VKCRIFQRTYWKNTYRDDDVLAETKRAPVQFEPGAKYVVAARFDGPSSDACTYDLQVIPDAVPRVK